MKIHAIDYCKLLLLLLIIATLLMSIHNFDGIYHWLVCIHDINIIIPEEGEKKALSSP